MCANNLPIRLGEEMVSSSLLEQQSIKGGYYLSNGNDIRWDINGINCRAHTTYRSIANPYIFPGWNNNWIVELMNNDIHMNFVLELKYYGTSVAEQYFTVDGVRYLIPLPNMLTQKRPGQAWSLSYSYQQVLTGRCDGLLHRALNQLEQLPKSINIQLASELDTDHEFGITVDGVVIDKQEADVLAAQTIEYIIDYFKTNISEDAPQPTFSIGCGGFDRHVFKRVHNEQLANKVDFLQWNAYATIKSATAYNIFGKVKNWVVSDLSPEWSTKPVIIAEWGVRQKEIPNQPSWILTVPESLAQLNSEVGPKIVIANYFNSGWGTLNPKGLGLLALRSAYASETFSALE